MVTPVNVYGVFAYRADGAGAVEVVYDRETAARSYARERSAERNVLSARVIRYTVGQPGTRTPVATYHHGEERGCLSS